DREPARPDRREPSHERGDAGRPAQLELRRADAARVELTRVSPRRASRRGITRHVSRAALCSCEEPRSWRTPVLVLTRRANQSIMIGHDIVVTVLEVRGDQVRLGIRAPRSVDVHREEVFAALQAANRSAASPPKEALESLGELRPKRPKE